MPHPRGVASDAVPGGFPDTRATAARGPHRLGAIVLDVVYIALTIALFALVGLVAKGVEKL